MHRASGRDSSSDRAVLAVDCQRLQCEIESIGGDLPEIRVPALERPQPGVLQLLLAPERGQLVDAFAEHVAAAFRGGSKIKQRSICIEDAGLHADQSCVAHARYLTYAHLRWLTVQRYSRKRTLKSPGICAPR